MKRDFNCLFVSIAILLSTACSDEVGPVSSDSQQADAMDAQLDFPSTGDSGDASVDVADESTCTTPTHSTDCAEVDFSFAINSTVNCDEGTLTVDWTEISSCNGNEATYAFTCTYPCPYGCEEGEIGLLPQTGEALIDEYCLPSDECPAPVASTGQVTTPVVTTSPLNFVGEEITVVGTLMTHPSVSCDDFGPCGTCYPSLTLDGVISLQGNEGTAGTLCGEAVECHERVDSCLPQWECYPFEIGRRVRVRGLFEETDGLPPNEPWVRLVNNYVLFVDGIEVIESAQLSGLYAGSFQTESIEGTDCGSFPNSGSIELVVAHSSEGTVLEFMSPESDAQIPVWAGWHTGQLGPEDDSFSVEGSWLGSFSGEFTADGISGTYLWSLSGPDCRVSSSVTAEQVY